MRFLKSFISLVVIGRLSLPRLMIKFTLHNLRKIMLTFFSENVVAISLGRLHAGPRITQITMP